jgi:hypothetical protein
VTHPGAINIFFVTFSPALFFFFFFFFCFVSQSNMGAREAIGDMRRGATELMLAGDHIDDDSAAALAVELLVNTTVTELVLNDNDLTAHAAMSMARVLRASPTLTEVHIGLNNIGDQGALLIADVLKVNITMAVLDIACNRIGDPGARSIAAALAVNASLTKLNLFSNDICNDGAAALADALVANAALTDLDLSFNQIDSRGASSFAAMLQQNATLTELDLDTSRENRIDPGVITSIAGFLADNASLTGRYAELSLTSLANDHSIVLRAVQGGEKPTGAVVSRVASLLQRIASGVRDGRGDRAEAARAAAAVSAALFDRSAAVGRMPCSMSLRVLCAAILHNDTSHTVRLTAAAFAPLDGSRGEAMMEVAHVLLHEMGLTLYGGFLRDFVLAGSQAQDIDCLISTLDDVDRVVAAARGKWGSCEVCGKLKAGAHVLGGAMVRVKVRGHTIYLDLVAKCPGIPHLSDADVANFVLRASSKGLEESNPGQFEAYGITPDLAKEHARRMEFEYYEDIKRSGYHLDKRFKAKYMERGWTCVRLPAVTDSAFVNQLRCEFPLQLRL